jgi:hypothetical protein
LPGVHLELSTILWSAKESIFKWYGAGKVDFKNHMQLEGAVSFGADEWIDLPFLFTKENNRSFSVQARIFPGLVLAFLHT